MGQPPIVPGLPPEQPQQPIYYQPPPTPASDVVGKTAVGTITVIAILVGLLCVLPMLICGVLAMIGGFQTS